MILSQCLEWALYPVDITVLFGDNGGILTVLRPVYSIEGKCEAVVVCEYLITDTHFNHDAY